MNLPLDPASPLNWLIGSLALALAVPQLAWLAAGRRRRTDASPAGLLAPLSWLVTALFFLLPPIFAWRNGALSLRLMGLAEVDWIADLTAGAGLAALISGVTLLAWLIYRRTLPGDSTRTRLERLGALLRAPVDAALQQWHWAFYRALVAAALPLAALPWAASLPHGPSDPQIYWTSWLGLGLIAVEAALNPFTRAGLGWPGPREALLRRAALAVATTALFALTGNFWLCLACDGIVETVIAAWLPLPKQKSPISSFEETGPA